jgi:hypothetical protein
MYLVHYGHTVRGRGRRRGRRRKGPWKWDVVDVVRWRLTVLHVCCMCARDCACARVLCAYVRVRRGCAKRVQRRNLIGKTTTCKTSKTTKI